MNDKTRAAMQQALDVLSLASGSHWAGVTSVPQKDAWLYNDVDVKLKKAITTLRKALSEQAEQEPVAWRVRGYNQFKTGDPAPWRYVDDVDKPSVNNPDCCDFEPLYAHPVRTKDLTDDEISDLFDSVGSWKETLFGDLPVTFARAVIAADREKNK